MVDKSEDVFIHDFQFGSYKLKVNCRKTIDQTIGFKLTVQASPQDIFESLRDFGGGFPDDIDPSDDQTPPDLLGLDVWPAALELSTYLASNPSLFQGLPVLELGAGIGLPALVCAKGGSTRVLMTDYEPKAMHHVEKNAYLCGVSDIVSGLVLDWTQLDTLPPQHRQAYPVLLAADVLYIKEIMPDFVSTVDALLAPGGVVLVGHQKRRALIIDDTGTPEMVTRDVAFEIFCDCVEKAGYVMRVLGSRDSPGFPGPLLIFGMAKGKDALETLPKAFI